MKMSVKKVNAFFLSAAMLLSLSACGSKDPGGESGSKESAAQTSVTAEEPAPSARVTIEGTKFMVNGRELWINGVNTPWQKWNDFNGQMDEKAWDDTFAQLAADNINCTRIWVNCNGESIVRLKTTGEVKAINESHWTELDKLFAIAEKHKVYIMATLLSFDHFKEPNGGYDKWRKLLESKEFCDVYADTYVKEFCQRYGNNEYLFSIDLMNEPDWVKENKECGKISWDHLSYLFGKCAAVIHENCDTLVTVGTAMPRYNSGKWEGDLISDAHLKEITGNDKAYIDFYSTHFYPWMKSTYGVPFGETPEEYGMDGSKPNMIGETPNDDAEQTGMTASEKYKNAYDNGWRGVMIWMDPVPEGEGFVWYKYDLTKEAANSMSEFIPDKIYPIGK